MVRYEIYGGENRHYFDSFHSIVGGNKSITVLSGSGETMISCPGNKFKVTRGDTVYRTIHFDCGDIIGKDDLVEKKEPLWARVPDGLKGCFSIICITVVIFSFLFLIHSCLERRIKGIGPTREIFDREEEVIDEIVHLKESHRLLRFLGDRDMTPFCADTDKKIDVRYPEEIKSRTIRWSCNLTGRTKLVRYEFRRD